MHTVSAGYVTGSIFVAAVSAIYLLRRRHIEIARRSMMVATSFGLASALSVVVLGDASGYTATLNQKMKIAAIEAMWETEPAPASFTVFGIPNQAERRTEYALRVPWVLGLIATRTINEKVAGIKELVERNEDHIRKGLRAYTALEKLHADRSDNIARADLEEFAGDLGYAFLLKRVRPDVENATEADITQAAWSTVPQVAPLFWTFRVMVACGFFFIGLFAAAFYIIATTRLLRARWLLWIMVLALPLPWIAAEAGWFVAEVGRQPWVIEGVLPTFLAVSSLTSNSVWATLTGFVAFYSALLIVDIYLMVKAIRLGPEWPLSEAPANEPALTEGAE